MLVIPLQSGSSGNALYVETGDVRLLFDAGLSAKQLAERLAAHGRVPEDVNALFISHDHSDHVRGAGVCTRKFGMPLFVSERTLSAAKRRMGPGAIPEVCHFVPGSSVRLGPVTVETVATPHDAADGAVFVVDDGRHRLGICTDLGHVFADMASLVGSVDGLFLESNYDEALLASGPYPASLKRRISGPGGHISNREAAELVAQHASSKLQWVYLAHLSEENNTPALALETHREVLGDELPLYVTCRRSATEAIALW